MTSPPPLHGPLHILLAEDNAINQELAARILSKRGHHVTVVDDGQAAVEAFQSAERAFDLILMDVQMPALDGPAAAAAIREAETGAERRVPIVALTAHAREGDRERLLAAGMDGYVAKPLDAQELLAAVEGAVGTDPWQDAPARGTESPLPADLAVDWPRALEGVGGDEELLRELAGIFLEAAPGMLAAVRAAVTDGPGLERAAHRLAGAVGNFATPLASHHAGRLEQVGAQGEPTRVAGELEALERAIEDVCRELARHLS